MMQRPLETMNLIIEAKAAQMLDTAAASGDVVPSLLVCNVDWSEMNDERQFLKRCL